MKTVFSLFLLLLISISSFAQSDASDSTSAQLDKALSGLFGQNVIMDVDTTVLKKEGPFYVSEDPMVFIMAMVVPKPYEEAIKGMDEQVKDPGVKFNERGEFVENGQKFAFMKGTAKKKGKTAVMELYATAADANTTIFVTGVCEKKEAAEHAFRFRKAAISAKLKK
jgi:hypothetical protein